MVSWRKQPQAIKTWLQERTCPKVLLVSKFNYLGSHSNYNVQTRLGYFLDMHLRDSSIHLSLVVELTGLTKTTVREVLFKRNQMLTRNCRRRSYDLIFPSTFKYWTVEEIAKGQRRTFWKVPSTMQFDGKACGSHHHSHDITYSKTQTGQIARSFSQLRITDDDHGKQAVTPNRRSTDADQVEYHSPGKTNSNVVKSRLCNGNIGSCFKTRDTANACNDSQQVYGDSNEIFQPRVTTVKDSVDKDSSEFHSYDEELNWCVGSFIDNLPIDSDQLNGAENLQKHGLVSTTTNIINHVCCAEAIVPGPPIKRQDSCLSRFMSSTYSSHFSSTSNTPTGGTVSHASNYLSQFLSSTSFKTSSADHSLAD